MEKIAKTIGGDLSTSGLSMGVRAADGSEDFVATPISGATTWRGEPAFELDRLPEMLLAALGKLQSRGWRFQGEKGSLSFSIRQHDMVLMGAQGEVLIPALSWRCNAAREEVRRLQDIESTDDVGLIEARFILPKLLWALGQSPELATQVNRVATTGDYIAWRLTGSWRLSASDAVSNALLDQKTKKLAADLIGKAGLKPNWFPPVIGSGRVVGRVEGSNVGEATTEDADAWAPVCELLSGWKVCAGLGDNHAGAVGCGLAHGPIVISAGSSGTVVRVCPQGATPKGRALSFEYYDDRLLLLMMAECALWYKRFRKTYADGVAHDELNDAASRADIGSLARIQQTDAGGACEECYPENWDVPLGVKTASVQFSIALALARLAKKMKAELAAPVDRFVLTGGLGQAPFFQAAMQAGIRHFAPEAEVMVSARQDDLAFQTATYGALINAMLQGDYAQLGATIGRLCPLEACESLQELKQAVLVEKMAEALDADPIG